jgi:1-acyl-sn-glycerol-3-phosphate acyltransferase
MEGEPTLPKDIVPELSKSAKKINMRKLESVPWAHDGTHPGSGWFWKFLTTILLIPWAYLFRRKEVEKPFQTDGGRLCVATHVNGLVDPISITMSNPKQRMVTLGRHDLTTSVPVISWIARRIGSQPVIRKAEQMEGIAEAEFAHYLNQRSMLTVAHALSGGYCAIIMPEGIGHQDSQLRHLRTGSMRSAINAASIAKERNIPPPVFQPIGLHFRVHYWFRTDLYLEQIEPVPVPYNPILEDRKKLMQGIWIEPPEDLVIKLRDELTSKLAPISRDAPDWETYRSWQLLAHLLSIDKKIELSSYKQEVLATRNVREKIRATPNPVLEENAKEASKILHSYNLDGRIINSDITIKHKPNLVKAFFGLVIMALCAPITFTSTGIQALFAWYLGNKTDEGIDARTTYHMIAALISPLIFWPLISLVYFYIFNKMIYAMSIFIFPIFLLISIFICHYCNLLFLIGYDMWTDYKFIYRSKKLQKSQDGLKLIKLIKEINTNLDVLK